MDDYKKITKESYNAFAKDLDQKFEKHFQTKVKKFCDLFLKKIKGKKIVDLGCGPGNHASYFQEHGLDVLCVDFSKEMLAICKKKGLKTLQMDLEDISFPDGSFEGVWAFASLLNLPKKKIPLVVKKISMIIKKDGILGLSMKEGSKEGIELESHTKRERYLSYFSDSELRKLFIPYFEILHFERTVEKGRPVFLSYIMKRK
ncbi:MAG: class I SAM-dependent methyltransferase [Candidatus Woesearchaeota archaeon]|jgi:ubiquinone/menaquinone biosynthesis C-methylase UbiE|nr:class I SAM-dependent methyltransferase [Candidatus Woesearchaeota archaeon]MDP7457658.1 class I SAM-dependent methyltransferase [Candidatus Woesearchaeota archaeon]